MTIPCDVILRYWSCSHLFCLPCYMSCNFYKAVKRLDLFLLFSGIEHLVSLLSVTLSSCTNDIKNFIK